MPTLMSWEEALKLLKQGKKVCRIGWNGKGMWLKLINSGDYAIRVPLVEGKVLPLEPWIGMKTAQDTFIPWLASQADQLADDWMEVV